jgi:hypothetical protein
MRQHAAEDGQSRRGLLVQSVEDDTGLRLEVVKRPLRRDRHDGEPATSCIVNIIILVDKTLFMSWSLLLRHGMWGFADKVPIPCTVIQAITSTYPL